MTHIKTQRFNDTDIHVLPYQGTPCFIAHEVGAALSYKDPKDFTRKITGDWSSEFIEGVECFKAEGEDLSRLKSLVGDSPTGSAPIIHPYTSSLLLLTREGVWLACAKANTDKGVMFRRWLARELLPALQDGRSVNGLQVGELPLSDLVPPPEIRNTEASRLLRAWTHPLTKDGTLSWPERHLIAIQGAELALGEPLPVLRQAVARRFKQLASAKAKRGAQLTLPNVTNSQDAA